LEPRLVEELCAFPNGAHGGQVDAASVARWFVVVLLVGA
jgi:phage terminase large subunit-like protein